MQNAPASLARRLGFFSLLIYGIGDILGAGIYALVGKVIGAAGPAAWVSFLLAAIIALFTGMSYAELTSRFPVSAGAAAYLGRAFQNKRLGIFWGTMVLGTGVISAATVTLAFAEYLRALIPIPYWLASLSFLVIFSFLSFWGITASARVNLIFTVVEVFGLMLIFWAAGKIIQPDHIEFYVQDFSSHFDLHAVFIGVTVGFYAFIGFEDLSNLAEESIDPRRALPKAILIAIAVTTALYILVCLALLLSIPRDQIAASPTPLLLVFKQSGMTLLLKYFPIIALLAIANTGLLNLIMGSRLLYGMSREGLLPQWLGKVHAGRETPWAAVLLVFSLVGLLVFTGGLQVLAQATSLSILSVFLAVNSSLVWIKWKKIPHEGVRFPIIFSVLGVGLCLLMLSQFPWQAWERSLPIFALAFFLSFRKIPHSRTYP